MRLFSVRGCRAREGGRPPTAETDGRLRVRATDLVMSHIIGTESKYVNKQVADIPVLGMIKYFREVKKFE